MRRDGHMLSVYSDPKAAGEGRCMHSCCTHDCCTRKPGVAAAAAAAAQQQMALMLSACCQQRGKLAACLPALSPCLRSSAHTAAPY